MGRWNKKTQKKENTAAKKNRGMRGARTMMTRSREDPAAETSTSFTGAAESSTTADGVIETFVASTEAAEYEAKPAPANEAAAVESDDEDFSIDEATVADLDPVIHNALAPHRQFEFDLVAEDYSEAVEMFARSPYGLVLRRDYKHDVFMAALDNVINHHIEQSNPSEERVANIKIIMNRFYQIMRIWIADGLEE